MPKFVVTSIGTVRYTSKLVLEAADEGAAEKLALSIMPGISPHECDDEGDLNDVQVNEVQTVDDGDDEPEPFFHTVHAAKKVGRETFSVISWSCNHGKDYRVCITLPPSSQHPDGYVYDKGKVRDLLDALDSFEAFVSRAEKAESKTATIR